MHNTIQISQTRTHVSVKNRTANRDLPDQPPGAQCADLRLAGIEHMASQRGQRLVAHLLSPCGLHPDGSAFTLGVDEQ